MSLALLLHLGHSGGLGSWNFEPSVVIGALAVLGLYVYRTRRSGAVADLRVASFLLGWLVMFLALVSPLDEAAHSLLSMHMLQHVCLTTIGPPLILLGLTPAVLAPLLKLPKLMGTLKLFTNPAVSGSLFIVNMWFWHVPPVYETALEQLPVHIAMHLTFIGTGLLFWWPVIQPLPQLGKVGEGARLLYLFVTGFPMELLALLLLASGTVLYDFYERSPGLWGLQPLEDQQIAGLIMGALGQFASFAGITWLFFRYLDQEGREASPQPGPADAA